MIKRKAGIFLLTLLVITGLAGTINSNPLSKQERKTALGLMKDSYRDAILSVKDLSRRQLHYQSGQNGWSVQEYMCQLASAEKKYWQLFENAMNAPANPELRAAITFTDEEVIRLAEDPLARYNTTEVLSPRQAGYKDLGQCINQFRADRMEHIRYMKNTTEDLRNHVVQTPLGWTDCYQLYLFIAGHSNRLLRQISELKSSEHFPGK